MTGNHSTSGIGGWAAVHCLTLRITVTQQFVGEVPGGYRFDLYYSGKSDNRDGADDAPLACPATSPFPAELKDAINGGTILSGNDWVTVNSRGIVDFDSHVTLALRTPRKDVICPVAGRLRGRARLADATRPDGTRLFPAQPKIEEVFSTWEDGFEEGSKLPLVLAAAFDVPNVGFADEQTALYAKSLDLASDPFTVVGHAMFRKASYGAIKSLTLELHKLRPAPRQASAEAAR